MTTVPTTIRERGELPAPAVASGGGAEPAISVRDIAAILKRRMILIIFLFMLLSGLVIGAWIVAYQYFPLYEAQAFVECVSDRPKPIYTAADEALNQKEFERFLMTQAQYVTTPDVLMEVLKTAEVKATRWWRDHEDRLLLDFEELIRVGPYRGTNLLRVSAETRDSRDPHVIVNQVVGHYLTRAKDFNVGPFRRERGTYRDDLDAVLSQISDKQEQLATLQRRLPPGFAGFESNAAAQDYADAKTAVAELERTTQELEGLHAVYNQPGGAALSPEDAQFVETDPTVQALSNHAALIRQQLDIERENLGENHREVKRLQSTLEVTNDQLEKIRGQRLKEVLAFRREQVHTAWLTSQHSLLLNQEKLAEAAAYMADMDAVIAQYRGLQEELELLKAKRDQIRTYIEEVDRIIRERAAIRVEMRQEAIAPLERSFPRMFLIPAGLALSLVFALMIPLALEFVDTSLRTPQDVVRHLRMALLGAVPDADDEEVNIKQLAFAVREAPRSMFAEVFRLIRTNLQFAATADRQRRVVVTSPLPSDGKTTVACNLSMMLAAGGRRVLLVDANFRRPALHKLFGADPARGLSHFLVGEASLDELVSRTDIPNLDVMTTGPLPPNPAELINSPQMVEFLRQAGDRYDQVVLDAPPVLVASDASVLAAKADGAILVCRAKSNSRGVGHRAGALLHRVGAHVFGVVLNATQVRRGGYFREQLRTFYEYQPEGNPVPISSPALPGSDAGGEKD